MVDVSICNLCASHYNQEKCNEGSWDRTCSVHKVAEKDNSCYQRFEEMFKQEVCQQTFRKNFYYPEEQKKEAGFLGKSPLERLQP